MDYLTGSNLLDFPDNVLLQQILPKIPLSELDRICLSSPNVIRLCEREELWEAKVEYDYPQLLYQKPVDMKWVTYYVYLNNRRSIPVYFSVSVMLPAFGGLPAIGGGPVMLPAVGLPHVALPPVALPPVGNVMFSSKVFDVTMNDLLNLPNSNLIKQPYYFIFANDDNKPYILVREPDNRITILSEKYDEITQVLISQS